MTGNPVDRAGPNVMPCGCGDGKVGPNCKPPVFMSPREYAAWVGSGRPVDRDGKLVVR